MHCDESGLIIRHQITKGMCTKLTNMFALSIAQTAIPYFRKVGVSMAELCRSLVPPARIIHASVQLGMLGSVLTDWLPFDHPLSVDLMPRSHG